MAFASTVTDQTPVGSKRMVYGTYTQGVGDTGGTISTGLKAIIAYQIFQDDAVVGRDSTRRISTSSGDIVLTVPNGSSGLESGKWFAIGN